LIKNTLYNQKHWILLNAESAILPLARRILEGSLGACQLGKEEATKKAHGGGRILLSRLQQEAEKLADKEQIGAF